MARLSIRFRQRNMYQRRSQSLVSLRRTARVRLSCRVPCGLAGQPCWASASERGRVRPPVRPSPAALLDGSFEHPLPTEKYVPAAFSVTRLPATYRKGTPQSPSSLRPCWTTLLGICFGQGEHTALLDGLLVQLARSTGRYKRESEAATLRPCWMACLSIITL